MRLVRPRQIKMVDTRSQEAKKALEAQHPQISERSDADLEPGNSSPEENARHNAMRAGSMLKIRRSNGPKLKKAPDHTQASRERASRTITMLPEDSEDVQLVLECMVDIYMEGRAKAGV